MARRRGAGSGRIAAGAAGPPGDAAARLLATAPQRFTAARESLGRELADRGDAAGALVVRKLRRPVGLAWVLNRVSRDRPEDTAALLAAGDRLRVGQRRALAGHGAAELRAAEEALRAAARTLRGRAREVLEAEGRAPSPGALARVELLLRVAATSPGDAREALRTATLSREPEVAAGDLSGLGLVAGGDAAAAARVAPADAIGRTRPPSDTGGAGRAAPRERSVTARAGTGEASTPSERERQAERKAHERAERAARARAEREARLRAREVGAARERLERAEKAASAASQAADAAERRAREAREGAERAAAAAAARRRELDALERGG